MELEAAHAVSWGEWQSFGSSPTVDHGGIYNVQKPKGRHQPKGLNVVDHSGHGIPNGMHSKKAGW